MSAIQRSGSGIESLGSGIESSGSGIESSVSAIESPVCGIESSGQLLAMLESRLVESAAMALGKLQLCVVYRLTGAGIAISTAAGIIAVGVVIPLLIVAVDVEVIDLIIQRVKKAIDICDVHDRQRRHLDYLLLNINAEKLL